MRYEDGTAFGVVVSPVSNICYDGSEKLLRLGALEQFQVWNVKQGRCTHTLSPAVTEAGARPSVTAIAVCRLWYLCDGSITVWDIVKETTETTLSGHKSGLLH